MKGKIEHREETEYRPRFSFPVSFSVFIKPVDTKDYG
jgi:hypothetical protein